MGLITLRTGLDLFYVKVLCMYASLLHMSGCQPLSVCTCALDDGFACTFCQHADALKYIIIHSGVPLRGLQFIVCRAGGGIIAPRCTGGNWGWRLSSAEVFFRLLARCEIQSCLLSFFFLLSCILPHLLLLREMGCQSSPPEAGKWKNDCNLMFYYLQTVIMKNLPQHCFHDIDSAFFLSLS